MSENENEESGFGLPIVIAALGLCYGVYASQQPPEDVQPVTQYVETDDSVDEAPELPDVETADEKPKAAADVCARRAIGWRRFWRRRR